MQREIKFRAWDKKYEQMIGVLKLDFLFESTHGIRAEGYCDCKGGITQNHESHKHEIFPEHLILMQFTGLRDKNRQEIYEGDVVRVGSKPPVVVRWHEASAGFLDIGMELMSNTEVIGNVFENPELLK